MATVASYEVISSRLLGASEELVIVGIGSYAENLLGRYECGCLPYNLQRIRSQISRDSEFCSPQHAVVFLENFIRQLESDGAGKGQIKDKPFQTIDSEVG